MSSKASPVLTRHFAELQACRACPNMVGPVVIGRPIRSKVLLIGQAPGPREGALGRPFAWTAGKTLFNWFSSIGLDEEAVRASIFISAVCRCFPGKAPGGGDRVPSDAEIEKCSRWINREVEILKPELIIPIGKLAISQFIPVDKLDDIIGKRFEDPRYHGAAIIPLPHPSGASTWFKREPGIALLKKALALIRRDPAFRALRESKAA